MTGRAFRDQLIAALRKLGEEVDRLVRERDEARAVAAAHWRRLAAMPVDALEAASGTRTVGDLFAEARALRSRINELENDRVALGRRVADLENDKRALVASRDLISKNSAAVLDDHEAELRTVMECGHVKACFEANDDEEVRCTACEMQARAIEHDRNERSEKLAMIDHELRAWRKLFPHSDPFTARRMMLASIDDATSAERERVEKIVESFVDAARYGVNAQMSTADERARSRAVLRAVENLMARVRVTA